MYMYMYVYLFIIFFRADQLWQSWIVFPAAWPGFRGERLEWA